MLERRSELYNALAESLAAAPAWLSLPGREWPLTQAAASLAHRSDAAKAASEALAGIHPEPEAARRARYGRLFGGPGRPRIWPYESMWRNGRFLGPEMVALEQLYMRAGLQVAGAEAADHVSVELAFLAYLARQQTAEPEHAATWKQLERLFIKQHAGQWLPALGHSLAASGDDVYGPIGALLAGWILENGRSQRQPRKPTRYPKRPVPIMDRAESCTLCGFCVQVCPTRALTIHETPHETTLRLSISACNGCRKCERACPVKTLQMSRSGDERPVMSASIALRRSPRVHCPGCGEATVSRAEIDFVAEQIGRPAWLPYCLPCRSDLREKQR